MKRVKGMQKMKNDKTTYDSVKSKISKLACGRSRSFAGIGTIKAFRTKAGSRRFSVSKSYTLVNCGNVPFATLCEAIRQVCGERA